MSNETKSRILARRAKFMAAAVASVGLIGCDAEPQVCLEPMYDAGRDTATDTMVDGGSDSGPQPCLTAPPDTSVEDTATDTSAEDTGPMPCLVPPLDGGE